MGLLPKLIAFDKSNRRKGSVKRLADYIKQIKKLIDRGEVRIWNVAPGSQARQIKQLERLERKVPRGQKSAYHFIISADAKTVLNEEQAERVVREFLRGVSKTASVAGPEMVELNGVMMHERLPVNAENLPIIWTLHHDSGNVHIQGCIVLWVQPYKEPVVWNDSYDYAAAQAGARRAERVLGIAPDHGAPEPTLELVPGTETWERPLYRYIMPQSRDLTKDAPQYEASKAARGVVKATTKVRDILKRLVPLAPGEEPDEKAKAKAQTPVRSWDELIKELGARNEQGVPLRNAAIQRTALGINYWVDRQKATLSEVTDVPGFEAWQKPHLTALWGKPEFKMREWHGIPEKEQRELVKARSDVKVQQRSDYPSRQALKADRKGREERLARWLAEPQLIEWEWKGIDHTGTWKHGGQFEIERGAPGDVPASAREAAAKILDAEAEGCTIRLAASEGQTYPVAFFEIPEDHYAGFSKKYTVGWAEAHTDANDRRVVAGYVRSASLGRDGDDAVANRLLEVKWMDEYQAKRPEWFQCPETVAQGSNGRLSKELAKAGAPCPIALRERWTLLEEHEAKDAVQKRGPAEQMARLVEAKKGEDLDLWVYQAHVQAVGREIENEASLEEDVNARVALRLVRGGEPAESVVGIVRKGSEAAALKTERRYSLPRTAQLPDGAKVVKGQEKPHPALKPEDDVVQFYLPRDYRAEAEQLVREAQEESLDRNGKEREPSNELKNFTKEARTNAEAALAPKAPMPEPEPEQAQEPELGPAEARQEPLSPAPQPKVRSADPQQRSKRDEAVKELVERFAKLPDAKVVGDGISIDFDFGDDDEKKRKKAKAKDLDEAEKAEREAWLKEKLIDIKENDHQVAGRGVLREKEYNAWELSGRTLPKPDWYAQLEQEWDNWRGTDHATAAGAIADREANKHAELELDMDRRTEAHRIIDSAPADRRSDLAIEYSDWLKGEKGSQMPPEMMPLLTYEAQPQPTEIPVQLPAAEDPLGQSEARCNVFRLASAEAGALRLALHLAQQCLEMALPEASARRQQRRTWALELAITPDQSQDQSQNQGLTH